MSFYALQQVNKESYDRIARNYFKFIANTNDPNKEPVTVFSPLSKKMLDELDLIREVSKDLQIKKLEEDRKAKEAEEQAKKENEEKNETKEDEVVAEETEEQKEE
ncbi:glutamic acid-rich protein [Amyelois transitella]|uniref:glutamic acid-rich protein n=1 Tax=Amyelois transitella TaxID=680683 RepID=UPI00298FF418|nr:glutamic acid-rich protein [Amyelois transitella]